ncbi:hypothetical protein A3L04_04485 [Thermococcus chitonophagus]|uniref:DUF402 domain-containing protein n=1 Tax=Thermococcus chitonophagus TaxID=54262 RepID=A0A160VVB8_9EURY|nr:DUF402 domain-containing protein [Thermococcus chitonophagus]ASJ16382.1 hypothetical protein A3L04_04485 [Thermococcus chitonophagus]CUX78626.1 hypothetical protein CHITON_1847 [Thermococcus chitonophagus]
MRIHLIYRRLPNRVLERYDELVADLSSVVIGRSKFEGMLVPLKVNGVEVIRNGYEMLYFAFPGKDFDILKVYSEEGKFVGLYVDVLDYTKWDGKTLEMLDLFLDIFIFPSGKAFLLDEDEIEMALNYGIISREKFLKAYRTANRILEEIKSGKFPPRVVWEYSL